MTQGTSTSNARPNPVWGRPALPPLPATTAGVREPVISLNGTWKCKIEPPARFWSAAIDPASWPDMPVPGYTTMQGFEVEENQEYAYRTPLAIPADFAGKRIMLRFDGVTGYARVWVGEETVREHYGGFTTWFCDVTECVTPGQETWLTVGVTDKPKEISVFNLGGIIRDVRLVALPGDCVTRLHVETELDGAYRDAVLKVTAGMAFCEGQRGVVKLALHDPQGVGVPISPAAIELTPGCAEGTVAIPVTAPAKWDAEHPNLYVLTASVEVGGAVVETLSRNVGFREVRVAGNKLLVNGQEVKLRGVNRHDVYPLTGRAVTPALVEQDIELFRAANINFIRTSHYPPREDMLDVCDRLGMYIEDEIAAAFVYQSIQPTQNDPDFTAAYMDQFAEMIERDRSHPCIIMWSLANECYWGRNFQKEYDYAKAADPSRPTIFSYPATMPEGTTSYDIWSLHYGRYDADPAQMTDSGSGLGPGTYDAPVLHDEYIHIPCYDLEEQVRDPAIREFWGESIKRFWESILVTDGALGGAIWGSIDDIMISADGYTRGREWGIIDGWRRKKPEYWLTQKGYSPIRIEDQPVANPGRGKPLRVPVHNWFDHTDLDEIDIHWAVGEESGRIVGLHVGPHSEGILEIPARDWQEGEVLHLEFYRMGDILVDAYNLPIAAWDRRFPGPQGPAPTIVRETGRLTVAGAEFSITFGTETGQIVSGVYKGSEIIQGGPHLNLVGIALAPWSLHEIRAETEGPEAVVHIAGSYGPIRTTFQVRIDGQGLIATAYRLDDLPVKAPRGRRLRAGTDVGGYREVGVSYTLSSGIDRLTWDRKGLWSAYPEGHIGRSAGTACREREGGNEALGVPPTWPWAEDMRNYALFGRYDVGGRGTKDFRSMKHGIWRASAVMAGTEARLRAESDGSDAVRLEVLDAPGSKVDDRDPAIRYVGTWIRTDDEVKNYGGTETLSNKAGDYVEFTFRGTGIAWIGSKDQIHGRADVYVDGIKRASGIDLFCGTGLGAARGELKTYQQVCYSQEGLPDDEHTIRIVVTGSKHPDANNTFVPVDAFQVLGTGGRGSVRFIINNLWNYPELAWGNYVKDPILIETGYSNTVRMRLTDHDRCGE